MEVRGFTVGPVQENCFLISHEGRGVLIDPGDEPDRLLDEVRRAEVAVEAILITHCHFDHVGAVAPVARALGVPVTCPVLETAFLREILTWPGMGPYEGYEADATVEGGEALEVAGMDVEVLFTPGHSPGHVTYAFAGGDLLASGDVLFQGSIGRTDLPGGDHATLLRSIDALMARFGDQTTVLPGHMGVTTLGAERATNPFLAA